MNRMLLVVPILGGAVVLLSQAVMAGPAWLALLSGLQLPLLEALAGAGCVVAACQFNRTDTLWKAWLLGAAGAFAWSVHGVMDFILAHLEGQPVASYLTARTVVLVVASTAGPASLWMFYRALNASGLAALIAARGMRAAMLLGLALAMVLAGPQTLQHLRGLVDGGLQELGTVWADAGEVLNAALVAPLLLTAFLLRGGALAWPFGLVAAGSLNGLFTDATTLLGSWAGVQGGWVGTTQLAIQATACLFLAMAGLAQRWALAIPRHSPVG